MKSTRFQGALLAAAASLALAACGGGGGSDLIVPSREAGASAQGFLNYIANYLATRNFDSSEPIDLAAFTPPAESDAVNAAPPIATSIDGAPQ